MLKPKMLTLKPRNFEKKKKNDFCLTSKKEKKAK